MSDHALIYVGHPKHLPDQESQLVINQTAAKYNLTTHPQYLYDTYSHNLTSKRQQENYIDADQNNTYIATQIEHHTEYDKFDMCLIWPKDIRDVYEVNRRPITRLVSCLSHGIPTIFYQYAPYDEITRGFDAVRAGLVRNVRSVDKSIKRFTSNTTLVSEFMQQARQISNRFTYEMSAKQYVLFFCKMVSGCRDTYLATLTSLYRDDFDLINGSSVTTYNMPTDRALNMYTWRYK
eukprot:gene13307-15725_t